MALLPLLIFIAIMAGLVYLISIAPFIGPRWKNVAYWVIGIFAVIWLLQYTGIWSYLGRVTI